MKINVYKSLLLNFFTPVERASKNPLNIDDDIFPEEIHMNHFKQVATSTYCNSTKITTTTNNIFDDAKQNDASFSFIPFANHFKKCYFMKTGLTRITNHVSNFAQACIFLLKELFKKDFFKDKNNGLHTGLASIYTPSVLPVKSTTMESFLRKSKFIVFVIAGLFLISAAFGQNQVNITI